MILFRLFATGVVDTAGVADTSDKFSSGVNITTGKFATGIQLESLKREVNLPPLSTTPVANN
jgi:hypothetical protein